MLAPVNLKVGMVVLLVIAQDSALKQAPLINEWILQIKSEGWSVVKFVVPSTPKLGDPTRTENVRAVMEMCGRVRPDAVFLVGAVARVGSGWLGYDNHGLRCQWGDYPYNGSMKWQELTDLSNYGDASPLASYRNVAMDGRYDASYTITPPLWAVGRADFSGLLPMNRGTNHVKETFNYLKEQVPGIDEQAALANYLRRDLDYRRKLWVPEMLGLVMPGQLPSYNWATDIPALQAARPEVSWVANAPFNLPNPYAGRDVFAWCIEGQDFRSAYNLSSSNHMMQCFWLHDLRSWEADQWVENNPNQQGDVGVRRWLQYSLITSWGYHPLAMLISGQTVTDGYLAYYRRHPSQGLHTTMGGDPTLPVARVPAPPEVRANWDASAEPNLRAYRLYGGTSSRNYQWFIDVPVPTTTTTTHFIIGQTNYFAVTCFNGDGIESPYSPEVSYYAPSTATHAVPSPVQNLRIENK